MKKWISLFLSLLMLFSAVSPAVFAEEKSYGRVNDRIPTIMVAGDGAALYVPDETAENGERQIFQMSDHLENFSMTRDEMYQAVANVLLPWFKEGVLKNNWDPYYENLETEVSKLFEEMRLDGDGNPQYGSNVSGWCQWSNWYDQNHDKKGDKGYYAREDYHFWYDWRLDPMQVAQDLHEFVQNVKRVTNSDKVALFSTCLGSNVALAYVAQFGTEDFYSLGVDATVANGAEYLSESISGKFKVDGNAILRFFESANETGMFDLDEFWLATIDLATKSGLIEAVRQYNLATIYDKIAVGVTSAIALGSFFTMPCYWACVCPEDYDEAIRYVFGEEGSTKRQEYAGLIAKLDNYHNAVGLHVADLMQTVSDNGVLLGIVAKYGVQMAPLNRSNTLVSDEFSSLTRSSFGATTSTIFDTLSDDYIAQREAEGKGKYISPDKQVDASTCMFPDQTWFIKGATHVKRTDVENNLLYVCLTADRQLTIDDFDWTQYMVFDPATKTMEPMTAENCHNEAFSTDKDDYTPSSFFGKLKLYWQALTRWLKLFAERMKTKLAEKQQTEAQVNQ